MVGAPARSSQGREARVGQILSGEELVKDPDYREQLTEQYSDALAVENEGYALASAGTATLQVLVIRGASDHADLTKDDKDHAAAAESAAAFAAQFLRDYLSLQAPGQSAAISTMPNVDEPAQMLPLVASPADRALILIDKLRGDSDLIADSREEVQAFARRQYSEATSEDRRHLLGQLTTALQDQSGTDGVIPRRLRHFGRAYAKECFAPPLFEWDDDSTTSVDWDGLLQQSSTGTALMLTQLEVWPKLDQTARRRCLTGLMGTAERPRAASTLAWSYLWPLQFSPEESERVMASFTMTPYKQLSDAGVGLRALYPRLRDDLRSGDFAQQNEAARYLLAAGNPHIDDVALQDAERQEIASSLILAAEHGAYGAQEATRRARLAEWTRNMLAAGIWTALTRDGNFLLPLKGVEDLLAAAAMAGVLDDVLNAILHQRYADGLRPLKVEDLSDEQSSPRAPSPRLSARSTC